MSGFNNEIICIFVGKHRCELSSRIFACVLWSKRKMEKKTERRLSPSVIFPAVIKARN